jgi:DNA invertase Pin-like site-specific DNA recombinase
VLLHLRVSTDQQTTRSQGPELEQLARARGWRVVERIEETASGAAGRKRPGLERLDELVHAGAVDVVAVWALDRLGRSMTETIRRVLELERVGIELVSARERWLDVKGPVRSLLVAIFGWVAEQERTRIVERTKAGLARARAAGVRLGRPRRVSALDRRRMLELAKEGRSERAIAMAMKIPRTTVQRAGASSRIAAESTSEARQGKMRAARGRIHFNFD